MGKPMKAGLCKSAQEEHDLCKEHDAGAQVADVHASLRVRRLFNKLTLLVIMQS